MDMGVNNYIYKKGIWHGKLYMVFILVIGIVIGIVTGRGEIISNAIIASTTSSVELIIKL